MSNDKTILTTLALLKPDNDEHWTNEGAPRLDVLKRLTGNDVTRAEVNAAAPGFNRTNPTLGPTAPHPQETKPEPRGAGEKNGEANAAGDLAERSTAANKELEEAGIELAAAQRRHAEAVRVTNALFAETNRAATSADRATNMKQYLASQKRITNQQTELQLKVAALLAQASKV